MNLQEWARATHRTMTDLPADERRNGLSMADIEWVLRVSITALIDSLADGDALQLDALGRLWLEEKPGYTMVSNLSGRSKTHRLEKRRVVRFRASTKLVRYLNQNGSNAASER